MMSRMRPLIGRSGCVFVVLVALTSLAVAAAAADSPTTRTVLLLHSEARLMPGIITTDAEIRSALERVAVPTVLYTEYLDAAWFPDRRVEAAEVSLLRRKYRGRHLDLVVPVGPAALRFALRHRAQIFPDRPIVFAAASRSAVSDLRLPPDIKGTWLECDWPANLALIVRLHPNVERIAFVHGSSAFDRAETQRVREAFAAYRGRLDLVELGDLSLEELVTRVAALPPRTIVLFFAFLRDRTDASFLAPDVLDKVASVAASPVYVMSDTLVAAGGIGGRVVSFEALGRQAGALAARVLTHGRTALAEAQSEDANVYMFNARALKRWGISADRLPPDSIVVNRDVSTWERYRWPLLGGGAIAVGEAILIAGLLIQRRQSTRARAALARSLRFELVLSEVSTTLTAVPPSEIEAKLQEALRRVAEELGFDRASLIEFTDDPSHARVTRSVAVSTIPPLPPMLELDRFPWTVAALRRGEVVQWPALDRTGADEEERKAFAAMGTEALTCVPLMVASTVVGALSLSAVRPVRQWSDALIQRSRLLGEVFKNAIVRRRADSAVHESEERFRLMADSAPVMVWMSGTDGGCTYVNPQWLALTGRTLEQELGAGWLEDVHPDDRARCSKAYQKHFEAREEFVLEYRLRRHDGDYRCIIDRGVPRFGGDGALYGYVGACSDITELKTAHAAMLEALGLRSAIFGSLYGHVAALDRTGVVVAVNEAWSQLQAEAGSNLVRPPIGANYLAACQKAAPAGDPGAEHREASLRAVLEGRAARTAHEYVAHSGREERWFEMTAEPLNRPEGGAIVTHIDITRQRRAEADARREREELAHVLRVTTLGELAVSLAHEISQPLAAIVSNAQAAQRVLAKEAAPEDEVKGALADIADDAKRAALVIRRLRALFRKEWTEQRTAVDINDLITEVLSILHTEFEPKGVELKISLEAGLPPVFGDAVQLQQVILNVVVNASEAMAGGGTLGPIIAVQTIQTDQGTVEITIEDGGPGAAEGELERMFQPFVTTKKTGLGMGLSISRSIVQAHGGRIWATRNADAGLTVHIELPYDERATR